MDYYIWGKHAVQAALSNKNRKITEILVTDNFSTQTLDLSGTNFITKKVSNKTLDNLTNTTSHQNIAIKTKSIAKQIQQIDLNNLKKIAILDRITDPHNFGAILRSAVFFGVEAIILPKDNSVKESGIVAKTSAGSLEYIDIVYVTNIASTINLLKEKRFWILGFDENGEVLDEKFKNEKVCLVLGSEGAGIRNLTNRLCDKIYQISSKANSKNNISSLNVSVAAAIAFYNF